MTCPQCGSPLRDEQTTCPCGWNTAAGTWREPSPGDAEMESLARAAIRRLDETDSCPKCQRPHPTYLQLCGFCGSELPRDGAAVDNLLWSIVDSYYVDPSDRPRARAEILRQLTKEGCQTETAEQLLDNRAETQTRYYMAILDTPEGREGARARARRELGHSLIWIVAGGGASIAATVSGAFLFFIWYGPLLYGIGKLAKSLIMLWALSERHAAYSDEDTG